MRIIIDPTHRLLVVDHSASFRGKIEQGCMERIVFSDEVVTSAAELNSLM